VEGRYCLLEPLSGEAHSDALWDAFGADPSGITWTYLPYGPFVSVSELRDLLEEWERSGESLNYAIFDKAAGHVLGWLGFLRVFPDNGSIEIGNVTFAPPLQRTRTATEAVFLMIDMAFQLGYRRCEWKCDSLNAASERAAKRFGFVREGIFRQDRVYKGRSRDTLWFSIIDSEWPRLRQSYLAWLDQENFNGGQQRERLEAFRA
jgi:RimJ/RimL family protein N-acetyltransferase